MTYQNIIIGIGLLVGLFLFPKTKPNLLRAIFIGLAISFGLSFFKEPLLLNLSFFSFGALTLGFLIYQGLNGKWTNFVIGLFAFLSFLWSSMNWLLIGELRFLMLVPVGLYVWTLIKKRESENGLSILTVFACYELSEFVILMEQWTQLD
ncbi:hypothetical protein R3X28_12840 [Maribacter sp. TH_r10]|uniref:hypothetical protein n=1 Tax=Maribacter sp. TH_r10 TaxID=3082086 RepID=UPI0029534703|nr:hypothetical protein [Maribacter sp. TH_r10]MDV7139772.1 hypothetical protein [Maribacter sp. TH_r10]